MNRPVILCVDDEKIILSSLKAQLQNNLSSNFQIEIAESAEEALEIIQELIKNDIDIPVVIADQIMPGMKGDEFLCLVKDFSPSTLTIMLTGQANADAVGKAVNKGGLFRYLSKPWDEDDLVLTTQSAIDSYIHQNKLLKQTHYQSILNQTLSLALSTLSFKKQISKALQYVLSIPCFDPPSLGAIYFINSSHVLNNTSEPNTDQPDPASHDSDTTSKQLSADKDLVYFQKLCDYSNNLSKNEIIIPLEEIEKHSHFIFKEKTVDHLAHYICPLLIDGDLIGLIYIFVSSSSQENEDMNSFLLSFIQTLSGMYRLSKSNHDLRISNRHLERHKFELEQLVSHRTEALNNALIVQEENNVKLKAANTELAYFATTDSLTGLLNRRHFFAMAEQRSDILKTHKKQCIIAMIDIDFFKEINDNFGHEIGDIALKKIAQVLTQNFDEDTLIGRFGGEEFSVLMPNLDIETALAKCKNLLLAISSAEFIALSKSISLTVSIGISKIKQSDKNIEKALFRADKALYVAKESGRNTVSVFEGIKSNEGDK
jgi:diguanylate cyclase (GGDEF)-like protein